MKTFLKLSPTTSGYTVENLSPDAPLTHDEAQKRTPDGAYTTFRTYHKFYVLNLKDHFDRLEESARLTGKNVTLDRPELQAVIVDALGEISTPEARIRVTIDLSVEPGDVYLSLEPFKPLSANAYKKGVETVTAYMHRTNPKAKLNRFLAQADAVRRTQKNQPEETLMLNQEKEILEGLSSNFYAVINGTIFTADEGVLSGTTRKFILALAEELNVPVIYRPVSIYELNRLDEAFISSTSRAILPVRKIDAVTIGSGSRGPVTARLYQAYNERLRSALADLRKPSE